MSVGEKKFNSASVRSNKRRKLSHGALGNEENSRSDDADDQDLVGDSSEEIQTEMSTSSADDKAEGSSKHNERHTDTMDRKLARTQTQHDATLNTTPAPYQSFSDRFEAQVSNSKVKFARAIERSRKLVESISQIIRTVPSTQTFSYKEAEKYAKARLGVSVPWSPRPAPDAKYTFGFDVPDKITNTGVVRHTDGLRVQLCVLMPQVLFQEKDYLNHRAFQKRSFYLACITGALSKSPKVQPSLQYALKDDNYVLPVLLVSVQPDGEEGKSNQPIIIEINPVFPASLGNVEKMLPSRNCLRAAASERANLATQGESSPFYNSSLRAVCSTLGVEQLLQQTQARSNAFEDARMLGGIWLERNGFTSEITDGGFGDFEWSYMCALLLRGGGHGSQPLFSPRYTSMQLFKAMLQVLGSKDFMEPFIVRGDLKLSQQDGTPTLFDAETGINVFYKMQPWSYTKLKACASQTLALLNSKVDDGPTASFGLDISTPALEYDETYVADVITGGSANERFTFLRDLHKTLSTASGDRVKAIQLKPSPSRPWAIAGAMAPAKSNEILIGLTLDADNASRTIDRGPSVEDKVATEDFRRFWGEKAELRKFVDAGIVECLVWSHEESVMKQIICFTLERHFNISESMIQCSARAEVSELQRPATAAANAYKLVQDQFQDFSDKLRNLQGLPLQVRSISAADPALRSGTVLSPTSGKRASTISVVMDLDTSGRWPESLAAINYTKAAFLTKIGALLPQAGINISTTVGIEDTNTSVAGYFNNVFLDVTYAATSPESTPTTFRLRIGHSPVEALLQKLLKQKDLNGARREQLQMALHAHRRNFLAAPAHQTAIKNLITQFAPLSTTIRLVKKWIGSHHLTNCVPAELLEIVCAYVFLNPHPWPVPGSSTTAFFRVLHLLSTWDWVSTPLIIDLSLSQDAISPEKRKELTTRFAAWRNMDPGMNNVTLFVATNIDGTGVVWTQMAGVGTHPKPEKVIVSRIQALATAALNEVNECHKILTNPVVKSVFAAELADYDFVLYLDPVATGQGKYQHNSKKKQFKNLQIQAHLDVETSGFDVIQAYLADIEQAYGDVAIFFHGEAEATVNVICGLWRPHVRRTREWKIRLGFSTVPSSRVDENATESTACEVNLDGILSEMAMLGEGIIVKVCQKGVD